MKLTAKKAKKILDFITKRIGCYSWELSESFDMPGMLTLGFLKDDKNLNYTLNDILIEKDGVVKTLYFYNDMTINKIVETLFKNKTKIMCFVNTSSVSYINNLLIQYSWVYLFKENETLEQLLIESELNG